MENSIVEPKTRTYHGRSGAGQRTAAGRVARRGAERGRLPPQEKIASSGLAMVLFAEPEKRRISQPSSKKTSAPFSKDPPIFGPIFGAIFGLKIEDGGKFFILQGRG